MIRTCELDDEEWKQVLGIIAQAPWAVANPLLMKLGAQLQAQQQSNSGSEHQQTDEQRQSN